MLIDNLSFSMPKGAIVGVIGGNGAGKSTLFRMLMGKEQPDSGSIEVGETVQLACVDQSRDDLDGSKSVFQAVSDGSDVIRIGNYEIPSRTYVGRFNFKGGDQQKFVKDLSGGERGRLHLALTLKEGGNVLLLDEPSNDLDVETLRSLEEALLDFPGAAIVISTIGGSLTVWRRISWRTKTIRKRSSSRVTTPSMKRIARNVWAKPLPSRIVCVTRSWPDQRLGTRRS